METISTKKLPKVLRLNYSQALAWPLTGSYGRTVEQSRKLIKNELTIIKKSSRELRFAALERLPVGGQLVGDLKMF